MDSATATKAAMAATIIDNFMAMGISRSDAEAMVSAAAAAAGADEGGVIMAEAEAEEDGDIGCVIDLEPDMPESYEPGDETKVGEPASEEEEPPLTPAVMPPSSL